MLRTKRGSVSIEIVGIGIAMLILLFYTFSTSIEVKKGSLLIEKKYVGQETFKLLPLEEDVYIGTGIYNGIPVYVLNIEKKGLPSKVFVKEIDVVNIEENSGYALLATKSGRLEEEYVLKIENKEKVKDYGVIHVKRPNPIPFPIIVP